MSVPGHPWDGGSEKADMVYSVPEQSPGWSDRQVLAHAVSGGRIVISNDKDFGELVFKNRLPHCGIVLMRLDDERIETKIDVISRFLKTLTEPVTPGHFIVLTEKGMRISSTN